MKNRQAWLGLAGWLGSWPAAALPWVLSKQVVPLYAAAGMELPGLTLLYLRASPLAWLLPLVVAVLWWRLDGHPRRGALTAVGSAIGALLVDGLGVVALWLPLLRLPDLVA